MEKAEDGGDRLLLLLTWELPPLSCLNLSAVAACGGTVSVSFAYVPRYGAGKVDGEDGAKGKVRGKVRGRSWRSGSASMFVSTANNSIFKFNMISLVLPL